MGAGEEKEVNRHLLSAASKQQKQVEIQVPLEAEVERIAGSSSEEEDKFPQRLNQVGCAPVRESVDQPPAKEGFLDTVKVPAPKCKDAPHFKSGQSSLHMEMEAATSSPVSLVKAVVKDKQDSSGLGRNVAEKSSMGSCARVQLRDVFGWLGSRMVDFCVLRGVLPTGRVFPLPSSVDTLTSMFPAESSDFVCVLRCVCVGAQLV